MFVADELYSVATVVTADLLAPPAPPPQNKISSQIQAKIMIKCHLYHYPSHYPPVIRGCLKIGNKNLQKNSK